MKAARRLSTHNQEDKRALKVAAWKLCIRGTYSRAGQASFPLLGRRVALNDRHTISSLTHIAPQAALRAAWILTALKTLKSNAPRGALLGTHHHLLSVHDHGDLDA